MAAQDSVFKKVWLPLIWLAVITIFEFVIAFTVESKATKVPIFILMTIAKAYFIVGFFMHMKYEIDILRKSILYPFISFIGLLIIILLYEGAHLPG